MSIQMMNGLFLQVLTDSVNVDVMAARQNDCGSGLIALIALMSFVVLLVNFVLIICNIYWKRKGLRILNIILSIPVAVAAIFMFTLNIPSGFMMTALAGFQFFMIKNSIPA